MNQYKTYKQNLEKNIGDVYIKIPGRSGLVNTAVFNTKVNEAENKIPDPDTNSLVTATVPKTKYKIASSSVMAYKKY